MVLGGGGHVVLGAVPSHSPLSHCWKSLSTEELSGLTVADECILDETVTSHAQDLYTQLSKNFTLIGENELSELYCDYSLKIMFFGLFQVDKAIPLKTPLL